MALVDEGFYTHAGRGGSSPSKVQDISENFVVMYEDEAYVAAFNPVTYEVGRRAAVAFVLDVRIGDIIVCAQKNTKFHSH